MWFYYDRHSKCNSLTGFTMFVVASAVAGLVTRVLLASSILIVIALFQTPVPMPESPVS